MPDETINDTGSVAGRDAAFSDEILTFAAPGDLLEGTILARSTATLNLVPFEIGGALGAAEPKAVLTYDVTMAAPGDTQIRAMTKGVVKTERLIIAADGDGSNVDNAVLDQLRSYGIHAEDTTQLAAL